MQKARLLYVLFQYATSIQVSSDCFSFMTGTLSYNSQLTPVYLLHTEKKRSSSRALCIYYGISSLPLVVYCTSLHCALLPCTALHCNALCYHTLRYTALYCTVIHCPALHCTALPCTALHCLALYYHTLHGKAPGVSSAHSVCWDSSSSSKDPS